MRNNIKKGWDFVPNEQLKEPKEYPKEVRFTRKITLKDKEFCRRIGDIEGCPAVQGIKGDATLEGYRCNFFGVNLFWRGDGDSGFKNEIRRCDECLRQEREQSHE